MPFRNRTIPYCAVVKNKDVTFFRQKASTNAVTYVFHLRLTVSTCTDCRFIKQPNEYSRYRTMLRHITIERPLVPMSLPSSSSARSCHGESWHAITANYVSFKTSLPIQHVRIHTERQTEGENKRYMTFGKQLKRSETHTVSFPCRSL